MIECDGNVNSKKYTKVLNSGLFLIFSNDRTTREGSVFMEDEVPPHTAKRNQKCLKGNGINKLPWLSQSPDINPIETLWGIYNKDLQSRKEKPSSKQEMLEILCRTWEEIPDHTMTKLNSSIPRRIYHCKLKRLSTKD